MTLFLEHDVADVRAHEDGDVVGRLVPAGLARHIVVDGAAVDLQTFEGDVAHGVVGIVACDDGEVGQLAVVAYVAEGDAVDACARGLAVFLVPAHLHLQYAALRALARG